jgi:predicted metal-binding protein
MKTQKSRIVLSWLKKCSCYQFGLPARLSCPGVVGRCKNPKAVCRYCYAFFGRFTQNPRARDNLFRNFRAIAGSNRSQIVEVFSEAFLKIPEKKREFFRWFGSGDVATRELGNAIVDIAAVFPGTKFWCPTQNVVFWNKTQGLKLPVNLAIRYTQPLLDTPAKAGEHMTLLPETPLPAGHFLCPGACEGCRHCWEKTEPVAFRFHGNAVLTNRLQREKNFLF